MAPPRTPLRRVDPRLMAAFEQAAVAPAEETQPEAQPAPSRLDVIRKALEMREQPAPDFGAEPDLDAARVADQRANFASGMMGVGAALLGDRSAPYRVRRSNSNEQAALAQRDARRKAIQDWAAQQDRTRLGEAEILSKASAPVPAKNPELENRKLDIEQQKVDIQRVRAIEIGHRNSQKTKMREEALMLTEDQNIVEVMFSVQYNLKSPEEYLFFNNKPDEAVQQVAETAMREIVGKSKMDYVLYEGRGDIAARVRVLMQQILDRYKAGITAIPGLEIHGRPQLSIVAYGSREFDVFRIAEIMSAKGWLPGLTQRPKGIHRMMSLIHEPSLDEYLAEVRAAVGIIRQAGEGQSALKASY